MDTEERRSPKNKEIKYNSQGKRIKQLSILLYIGVLFLVAVTASMISLIAVSREYRFNYAAKQSGDAAENACHMADLILKYDDPGFEIFDNEEKREEIHSFFRSICEFAQLQYLYLYTVDDKGVRHHIIVAAADEDLDRAINMKAGFGTTGDAPLHTNEIKALKGDVNSGYEIVNNQYGNVCTWYLPVFDTENEAEVVALIGADYDMEHIRKIQRMNLFKTTLTITVVFTVTFILALLMIRKMVLNPLRHISERMKNFMNDRNCELPPRRMPFEGEVEDEISDIANSFQSMGKDINEYLSEIENLTRAQVANQVQMDVARNIQYGIVLPSYTEEKENVICEGYMQAAKSVGGDFYGSFFMYNGNYCGFIGDVSDKGVSAALFMVMTRTMLRDHLKLGVTPADAINSTNTELCRENPAGMFVTVFIFTLDVNTGEIIYANAGHNPPIIIGKDEAHFLDMDPGMVVGLMEDVEVKNHTLKLEPGQSILIYTDGITDSVNEDGEGFGEKRLLDLFNCVKDDGFEEKIVERITTAVGDYSRGCVQFDDMTVLSVTYEG